MFKVALKNNWIVYVILFAIYAGLPTMFLRSINGYVLLIAFVIVAFQFYYMEIYLKQVEAKRRKHIYKLLQAMFDDIQLTDKNKLEGTYKNRKIQFYYWLDNHRMHFINKLDIHLDVSRIAPTILKTTKRKLGWRKDKGGIWICPPITGESYKQYSLNFLAGRSKRLLDELITKSDAIFEEQRKV